MSRPAKDYEFLHCKLAKTVSHSLIEFCSIHHMTKTSVVENAITEYIDTQQKSKNNSINKEGKGTTER